MRRAMVLLLAGLLCLPLLGCGRKGQPRPPGPPGDVIYPRSYPKE